jgi:tRNA A-37 threonylcarbamoyl transferase component Bud32
MAITSLASFVDQLRESRLLSLAQLEEITDELTTRFTEPKALARHLIEAGWLTPYQVNQLFQGRGQHLVLGRYLLLERLGEGGMGQVFKARHQSMNRIVALKIIRKECLANPDAVRRFQREIEAAAQLTHPNIVIAHDADHVGDTHFFAMEFVEGTDLARLVHQKGPLPVAEACDYIRQAALGLQHASERGLVHRDIKPGNLLLTKKGNTIKVLDMGLARLQQTSETIAPALSLTVEGSVMGTPDYIAPEQAHESHSVDTRADIYSLGCTLYFLLTGQVPFPGGTLMQKLMKHQSLEPPSAELLRPDLPPALLGVMRKMMAKRPEDRYQTPLESALALEQFTRSPSTVPLAVPVPVAMMATVAMAPPAPQVDVTEGQAATMPVASASVETRTDTRLLPSQPAALPAARRLLKSLKKRPRTTAAGLGAGVLLIGGLVLMLSLGRPKEPPPPPPEPPKPPTPFELIAVLGGDSPRHWGAIACIAVSPNGKVVATGGEDSVIRLWDAETMYEHRKPLTGHTGGITCLAFSPDSQQLLSGSSDNTVRLWEIDSGRLVNRLATLPGTIYGVAFSRDGQFMLTCGYNQSVRRWIVKSAVEKQSLGSPPASRCRRCRRTRHACHRARKPPVPVGHGQPQERSARLRGSPAVARSGRPVAGWEPGLHGRRRPDRAAMER